MPRQRVAGSIERAPLANVRRRGKRPHPAAPPHFDAGVHITPFQSALYGTFRGRYPRGALIATTEIRRIEKNLLPNLILARARAQSVAAFARGYTGTLFLLIRVDDDQGDLRVGLDESTAEVPRPTPTRDRIGFSTAVDLEDPRGSLAAPPPALDYLELRKRLLAAAYYAVPIKKRELGAKPFAGKVSVGRARNNDIVLRHATVSKFHAWFDLEGDRVLLADARSKNRTWLSGQPLTPNDPVEVPPGAAIRFGRVSTLVVTPEALWRATVDAD